jgi:acyl-CoA reductase-like NAD-dependent aldehyde dehydrogenase
MKLTTLNLFGLPLTAPEEPALPTDEELAADFDAVMGETPEAARALFVAHASAAQRLQQEHAKATAQRERSKMKAAIAEAAARKAEVEKALVLAELDKVREGGAYKSHRLMP